MQDEFDLDATGPGDSVDAIDLLQSHHDEIRQLFEDYELLLDENAPRADRQNLALEICAALTLHAALEEELLYPAARAALDNPRVLDAALVEHAVARGLVAEIEGLEATDELFDARVTVLGEYVLHHIEEEEEELLPQLYDTPLDLTKLGQQMADRREELSDMGCAG